MNDKKDYSMYSQLYLDLKINNQVTIGLQNTRITSTPSKSAYLTHNEVTANQYRKHFPLRNAILKYKILADSERKKAADNRKCAKWFEWFGGVKIAPLDITEKLQAKLESFPHNLLGLRLMSEFCRYMIHFGQYRPNKPTRFGHIQAQHIHECGAALEMIASEPRFCHVTTLTLPANTHEAFSCIAARSGDIINSLFQPIRDKYSDTNHWFFVWEYQARGALHAHIAHYHPDECEGMLIGNIIIEQWHKILCDISESSGVDMFLAKDRDRCTIRQFHQHHTQPMRKSVAGYFSKYASKASKKEENNYVKKFSLMYPPSRFWGCSSQLKLIRKENSFNICKDYRGNKDFMYMLFVHMHKMISACNIVLQNSYNFKVDLTPNLCVAEGFRNTFYLSPSDYQKVLEQVRNDFELFQGMF